MFGAREREKDCKYYDGHRRGDQSNRSPNIGDARELLTDDSDTTGVLKTSTTYYYG